MDGGQDGAQAQGAEIEGWQGEPQDSGQPQGQAREQQAAGAVGAEGGSTDYQVALKAKDARIAELEGRITDTVKASEATETLNTEIAALKQQIADERVEFALRLAGARSVKVAKAVLDERDGDVAALVAAEPWLFEQPGTCSQNSSQTGATGLEPAGVAGGDGSAYMRRWERIAGLTDEGKDA